MFPSGESHLGKVETREHCPVTIQDMPLGLLLALCVPIVCHHPVSSSPAASRVEVLEGGVCGGWPIALS